MKYSTLFASSTQKSWLCWADTALPNFSYWFLKLSKVSFFDVHTRRAPGFLVYCNEIFLYFLKTIKQWAMAMLYCAQQTKLFWETWLSPGDPSCSYVLLFKKEKNEKQDWMTNLYCCVNILKWPLTIPRRKSHFIRHKKDVIHFIHSSTTLLCIKRCNIQKVTLFCKKMYYWD